MNRINPEKLLLSRWTALQPVHRERHFIVTRIMRQPDGKVLSCELESVLTKRVRTVRWRDLEESGRWLFGWR